VFSPCGGFPQVIRASVIDAAEAWFVSPERPRPAPAVLSYWDRLVEEWLSDPRFPLLVRKSGSRGCEHSHASSGRTVVCADNSPAHWTLAMALAGETPTVDELLQALESAAWPVVFALSKADAAKLPRYRGVMARSARGKALNVAGWKVCHIRGVADESRGADLDGLSIQSLVEHSRRFLAPSNMFLVPNSHAGFGELPEVLEVFARHATDNRNALTAHPVT
jgi:hypothetical protein